MSKLVRDQLHHTFLNLLQSTSIIPDSIWPTALSG